ncbi:MAG: hypothetical protein IK066_00720 [Kiritimatiellae bacterium]|nr:hypothetical protein [Kiritimatiellia bacterium]
MGEEKKVTGGDGVVEVNLRVAVEEGNVLSVNLGFGEARYRFDTARDASVADGILTVFVEGFMRILPAVVDVGKMKKWRPGEEEPPPAEMPESGVVPNVRAALRNIEALALRIKGLSGDDDERMDLAYRILEAAGAAERRLDEWQGKVGGIGGEEGGTEAARPDGDGEGKGGEG